MPIYYVHDLPDEAAARQLVVPQQCSVPVSPQQILLAAQPRARLYAARQPGTRQHSTVSQYRYKQSCITCMQPTNAWVQTNPA